jgi:hypothetical protein
MIGLRASPEMRASIEKWAARQPDEPSLSEAIRRLVELGLASAKPVKPFSSETASKASELAARAIDRIVDPTVSPEEQQNRKRRLIKGPKEFREMRSRRSKGDEPK